MEIEIELRDGDHSIDLYSLRDYLEKNIEGLKLQVRSQPAIEGKMGGWEEGLGMGMVHGIWAELGKVGIELSIQGGKKLYTLIKQWQQEQNEKKKLAPGFSPIVTPPALTMGDGNQKVYITEDKDGKLQVFDNFDFAIDARHTCALLIGNSEFDGNFPSIPPVRNNLVDFYNLLVDKRHIGLPRENVEVKLDKTSNEIEELLLKISRIPDMETLIIYYAGHGHKADRESLVLTARNTKKVDDDIIGGIDFNFITEKVLKRSTAKQKIVIIDACHSGLAAQGEFDPIHDFDVKGTYILTSSGDEASYFEKKSRYTFFTGTLLNLLNTGISDETKEMLSLEDLYKLSFEKLVADKFPAPHFKNQLNIAASVFHIARNPRFSEEKLKRIPETLIGEGKAEEALEKYKELVRRYPDDNDLRRKKDECEDIVRFNELVHTADSLMYEKKDYTGAIEKYRLALKYKKDDLFVINKIAKCRELLGVNPTPPPPSPPVPPAPIPPTPPKPLPPAPVNLKEFYSFNDRAALVTFSNETGKPPLEIPYEKMREFSYFKPSHTVMVGFDDKNGTRQKQSFVYSKKDEAIQTRNYLMNKTGIKKWAGGKRTTTGELVAMIFIWSTICAAYIGITNWAKSDHDEKGIGKIIVDILDFVGSIITPTVAIVFVSIFVVIAIISVISETRKITEEKYTR